MWQFEVVVELEQAFDKWRRLQSDVVSRNVKHSIDESRVGGGIEREAEEMQDRKYGRLLQDSVFSSHGDVPVWSSR